MPAIIVKRNGSTSGGSRMMTTYDQVSVDPLVVVVIGESQVEVYTDKEAEDVLENTSLTRK